MKKKRQQFKPKRILSIPSLMFFVPELKTNLLSIDQLQEKSYKVYIKSLYQNRSM
jgi:hypothetical protein